MELPFIYKYQPIYLDDFEVDSNFIQIIKTLIEMNSLNILLIGASGSGKSSYINAIIKEYYNDYSNNNTNNNNDNDNVLYINSLKEQGISYYRSDVKTFCQTASIIPGKKKIVLLDDLDLVNEQSQQVFRNCIDKYSHNVHFIGSSSNTLKIIDSLQSRMTMIKIKSLQKDNLIKIIKKISKMENIYITPEAEEFILSISNNSIRILINYLEKFKLLEKNITKELAINVCTNISFTDFDTYTDLCKNKNDLVGAIKILYNLSDKGYSVMDILDNFFLYIKTSTYLTEEEKYKIIPYICKYITVFNNIHEDEIELANFTNNIITIFS
jgi:replication factor C subunit 2/4